MTTLNSGPSWKWRPTESRRSGIQIQAAVVTEKVFTFRPYSYCQEAAAGRGLIFVESVFFASSIWIFLPSPGWMDNGPGDPALSSDSGGRRAGGERPDNQPLQAGLPVDEGKAPVLGFWPLAYNFTGNNKGGAGCSGISPARRKVNMTIQAGVKARRSRVLALPASAGNPRPGGRSGARRLFGPSTAGDVLVCFASTSGEKGLEKMNGLYFNTGFLDQLHRQQAIKTAGKKNKCFHFWFHPFRVP